MTSLPSSDNTHESRPFDLPVNSNPDSYETERRFGKSNTALDTARMT